jgi:K(+)-stimulated pyrophosphate-energized sodium pump
MGAFYAMASGLIAGVIIGLVTEYYTSDGNKPTRSIAEASQTGAGTTIITGLSVGMMSTVLPILLVSIAMIVAFKYGGLYGIAISAVGMLGTLGITLATDCYGPVADNAAGIAEMAKMNPNVRKRAESLDAVGNTTAAMGKGFAIASAALTTLALFASYQQAVKIPDISLTDPMVVVGLFIGGLLPFLFCALAMQAVGETAKNMVEEVRRQFKHIKGLMEGKAKPDYEKCVAISTDTAIKRMTPPSVIAVLSPIVVGLLLGPQALGGLLIGNIVTGFLLAIMMANSGGAWDNAKKFIEKGNLGGKGSMAHKAAVIGDTVGDPFKDTAGPSLNILIKLISIIAIVFAPLFI